MLKHQSKMSLPQSVYRANTLRVAEMSREVNTGSQRGRNGKVAAGLPVTKPIEIECGTVEIR